MFGNRLVAVTLCLIKLKSWSFAVSQRLQCLMCSFLLVQSGVNGRTVKPNYRRLKKKNLWCHMRRLSNATVRVSYFHLRKGFLDRTSPLPLWRHVSYLIRELISRFTRWSINKVVPLLLSVPGVPALWIVSSSLCILEAGEVVPEAFAAFHRLANMNITPVVCERIKLLPQSVLLLHFGTAAAVTVWVQDNKQTL